MWGTEGKKLLIIDLIFHRSKNKVKVKISVSILLYKLHRRWKSQVEYLEENRTYN